MNELISVKTYGSLIESVSCRDLYIGLGLSQAHWAKWSNLNIENNDFFKKDIDWIGFTLMVNGNKTKDYAISIDFAKHIALMAKTDKSHEYRNYLIACEKNKSKVPTNFLEAMQLATHLLIEKQKALEEVDKLNTIIDNRFGYCSILRASIFLGVHETTFHWRSLKDATKRLGLEVKKVPSPRYGYQNLYPLTAFKEVYHQFDFDDLTPELVDDKDKLTIL